MINLMKKIALATCLLVLSNFAAAQIVGPDSKGTEFIFAFDNNYRNAGNLSLFITGSQDTQGTVEVPGFEVSPGVSFSETFTVTANEVTTVELPRQIQRHTANGKSNLGIYVSTDAEVSIYGMSLRQYTSDAFLALPIDVLGTEYIVTSYDGLESFGIPSQFAIVATADNTQVQIVPSTDVGGNPAGIPFFVTLDRCEVYKMNILRGDLTGTLINSSDPVAVMGGHECADVPSLLRSPTGGRIGWCDHLIETLTPVSTWGQSFAVIPLATRLNGSVVRMLAVEDGTTVKYGPANDDSAVLNQGEFAEVILTEFAEINSTAPIQVTQYSPGQGFDGVQTDPFMMLIPPNEQFLDEYTFATPETGFSSHFVNVAVPTTALSSLQLNSAPVDTTIFTPIGNSGLSGAQIPLTPGSYTLSADQPFGIYVYGFNSFESYGYPGGMALVETNLLGDSFSPNIGTLRQIGKTVLGVVSDSEDINANGILDAGEDLNGNGIIDRRTEDINGDGILDASEDTNANGVLDRDRGILKVELLPGSNNLVLEVLDFVGGQSPLVNFRVDLIDPEQDGNGILRVRDLNDNVSETPISVSSVSVLSDVHLITTVSGDGIEVDQATFSIPPVSIDVQAEQTIIEWRFDSLRADQIEDIGFDVVLQNPQPNEERLVTQKVELSYINALGGQRINTELGPQTVTVTNTEFALQASTDKLVYGPNETVQLQATIQNVGSADNSGTVEFIVEDLNGNIITSFAPTGFGPLVAPASTVVNESWNTALFIAGSYQLRVILRDGNSRITNEQTSVFTIANSTVGEPTAALDVTVGVPIEGGNVFIEKLAYHTIDNVQIQARVSNETLNTLLGAAIVRITVTDPTAALIFTEDHTINAQLVPGSITEVLSSFNLNNAEQGDYSVVVEYIDSLSTATLLTENAQFTVTRNVLLSLEGSVSVQLAELVAGDAQVCTDVVINLVNDPLSNLPIQKTLVNISTQQEITLQTLQLNLQGEESITQSRNIATQSLATGDYACVLSLVVDGQPQTIGYAPFTVYRVTANAGSDATGFVDQLTTLNGSLSRVAPGESISYQWTIISAPAGSAAVLNNSTTIQPSFTPDEQGEYVIELITSTTTESSIPDQVVITVPNRLPLADAGADQSLVTGLNAQLDGSASSDIDNDPLTYQWTITQQPAGASGALSNPTAADPTLLMSVEGTYIVQLIVNDGFADSAADTVELTATSGLPVIGGVTAQFSELLRGDTQICTDVLGNRVSQAVNGLFVQKAIINQTTQVDVRSNNTNINLAVGESISEERQEETASLASGSYACVLRADAGTGTGIELLGTAPFNVYNLIANPGENVTALVGDTVTLDGSGSREADGLSLNYQWRFVSVPDDSNAELSDTSAIQPSFFVDQQGTYVIELIVNNGAEDSLPKQVEVTVANRLPEADAGPDQQISAGQLVFLDGTNSIDLDGDQLQFNWTILQAPASSQSALSDPTLSKPALLIDVEGVYRIQLIVNDGFDDSLPDTVLLSVGNVPPVADAGTNIVALIGDNITLDGSNSNDANGDLLSFAWIFDSIPVGSTATLLNTGTAMPFFTVDVEGDYTARLIVNDGISQSEPDTVTVTVGNVPPVADAGPDQSSFVGNLVFLNGSGSSDQNNDLLTYRWNIISKPEGSNAQLINAFSVNPRFVLDVQGDYIIQLIVNDGTVDSEIDTVFVTVGNLPPVARPQFNAVGDIYTGETINLIGNNSFDPDGDPITYEWSFIDRPAGSTALFTDNTAANPSFVIDTAGDYIAQLTVNDGQIDSQPENVFIEGVLSCIDNLAIRPKFNKISLTWDYNPDVEEVQIERATNIDGPYEVIANSTSTYATYLDQNLDFGTTYYYRISGQPILEECDVGGGGNDGYGDGYGDGGFIFIGDGYSDGEGGIPINNNTCQQNNIIECRDVGEGLVCNNNFCNFGDGRNVFCGEETCQIVGKGVNDNTVSVQCGIDIPNDNDNTGSGCEPFDQFCQAACNLYAEDPGTAQEEFGGDFNFERCEVQEVPTNEIRVCQTQIIASTPVGRVRVTKVPDLTGLTLEAAELKLQQSRLTLGDVVFERTTAIPAGQIIRQDMPRNSVMPPNTPIDLVIATRGTTTNE